MDMLSSEKVTDPETIIVFKEEIDYIESKVAGSLSKLEWKVLREYLLGKSYQEIAENMDKPIKSIDNALQRVKRKLEAYVENRRY
jgi:RNA polymerase sporulation-specific sigma factor